MTTEKLEQTRGKCTEKLYDALLEFVRENGQDYNDYFLNEHGIEASEEGNTIRKCFDISGFGCHMALPLNANSKIKSDVIPTLEQLSEAFLYTAYRSLYIERYATGGEDLLLYGFYNDGVNWQSDDAEPFYMYAHDLSLAEMSYLYDSIINNF